MNIKAVQCCQCGSPLQLPESGSEPGLLRCQYCSALLEVQQSERGITTCLQTDVQALQKTAAQHETALRQLEFERGLSQLDHEWKERWGERVPGTSDEAAAVYFAFVLLGMGALVTLLVGWTVRGDLTVVEKQLLATEKRLQAEQSAEDIHRNISRNLPPAKEYRVRPVIRPIPWRPNWPARIGSLLVFGALGGIAYAVRLYADLCESAASEYQARRLALIHTDGHGSG